MSRKRRQKAALPSNHGAPQQRYIGIPDAGAFAMQKEESWSGPVPPPSALRGYEDVLSGAANRIITMAESEMSQAHTMQRRALNWSIVSQIGGQLCALVIALCGLYFAFQLGMAGHQWASSILGGGSLATIVLGFLRFRQQ